MQLGPERRFPGTTTGRVRSDLTIAEAERLLSGMLPTAPEGDPQPVAVTLEPLVEWASRSSRSTILALAWAVLLVTVIACVNVGGLTLARGASRRTELATRAAIGAGRGRLVRQLVTEGLVLSTLGGTVGVLSAWLALDVLVANLPLVTPNDMTPVAPRLNPTVLACALVAIVGTGVLFSLWPALRLSRSRAAAALSQADARHGAGITRRGGQALVGVEVALTVVLLAGAGLMLRSFERLVAVDLGFDPRGTIMMGVMPLDGDTDTEAGYFP